MLMAIENNIIVELQENTIIINSFNKKSKVLFKLLLYIFIIIVGYINNKYFYKKCRHFKN